MICSGCIAKSSKSSLHLRINFTNPSRPTKSPSACSSHAPSQARSPLEVRGDDFRADALVERRTGIASPQNLLKHLERLPHDLDVLLRHRPPSMPRQGRLASEQGRSYKPPSDEEVAAIREAANEARLRVGTDAERISDGWRKYGVSLDQQAVELWEDVHAAIKPQQP